MTIQPKPLPPHNLPELRQVGKPLRRVDALGKAVGATVYAGDFSLPLMLHAKVFRSTQACARIVRLDVSKARDLPGVACVLTAADLPDVKLVSDMPGQTGQKQRSGSDVPVLAADQVRFYGEPIALVAAETLAIAERALKLIEIEYEVLPGVFDPLEALQPGATVENLPDPADPSLRNVVARWAIRKGDVQAGFAEADLIVENTFRVPYQEHAFLEPEAGVAWTDERGVLNIRVSTQVVEHFRSIARAVGIPQSQIRIQGTMVGGGFGGKEDITVEIYLALLTKATQRPVKMVYTREESTVAHSKRHPYIISHRTGVTRDGRITASRIKVISDSGAYPYLSPYVLLYTTVMAPGPYRVDNVQVDSVAAFTNNPFTSAFRGFGGPQACFAYEQQMDAIADALGLDRYELRRRNYVRTGDTTATGQPIETAAWLEETATRVLAALEAGNSKPETGNGETEQPSSQQPASSNQHPVRIGRGISSFFQSYGRITWLHDTSQAWVGVEQDGTVLVRAGVPDLGAGQINSLCQIAAEVLGVPLERVVGLRHRLGADAAVGHVDRDAAALHVGQCHAHGGERGAQGAGRPRGAVLRGGAGRAGSGGRQGLCQARSGASAGTEPIGEGVRQRGSIAGQPGDVQGAVHRSDRSGHGPGPRLPRLHLRRLRRRGGGGHRDRRGHRAARP